MRKRRAPVQLSLFELIPPLVSEETLRQVQAQVRTKARLAKKKTASSSKGRVATRAGTGMAGVARDKIYTFRVALMWKKRVWRTIEVRGNQTLHHLHQAIQGAFGWDDDHLYSFYMSGKRWDPETEYAAPAADEGRKAHRVKIGVLGLVPTQRLLYLFDYGDELMHEVRVESVDPAVAECKYPRIVESHGEAPPQYPEFEEE